ncbi:aromatic hydrocarbon degradation membrane protein [Prevotella sp. 10(H)]|uniref:aromatic hydrocarbon degradation membrane protein n=1 Tax=Prevotella sp. 10(H) TaxID=1158294 RepID=UPI0004A713B2|nr:aromatic hydrocarbon degradation membrane protein [Prevotella sp. 10(H)]
MKKRSILVAVLSLCQITFIFAGGILTNTNQSAHFIRMVARDASLQIDAAYTNPAGLVKLKDGFHFSFTNQSAFQTRTITSTYAPFAGFGGNATKEFEGKASAPIIPSLQAAYKTGKWVLSGNIAVTGGGGKATFNRGLPSFEAQLAVLPGGINKLGPLVGQVIPGATLTADKYSVDAYMRGSSFIYGAQLGGSYEINDMFSVYGGFRLNIVNNKYEGHLRNIMINPTSNVPALGTGAMVSAPQYFSTLAQNPQMPAQYKALLEGYAASTADKYLESSQSGWGISPILGFNFNYKNLNVGMKFEFKTPLNVENKTKVDNTGQFGDGVNTAHDIPALFTVGASYQITPKLLASVGYHHFFDSSAGMAAVSNPANPAEKIEKQNFINGGTNEYLAGIEYRIDRMFLISAGGQITRYGSTDAYQQDLSFSCNSYSVGLGGEVTVAKNVAINVGYFWTTYSDWTKKWDNYNYLTPADQTPVPGTDVFSRTNKVFAAGVDFSF